MLHYNVLLLLHSSTHLIRTRNASAHCFREESHTRGAVRRGRQRHVWLSGVAELCVERQRKEGYTCGTDRHEWLLGLPGCCCCHLSSCSRSATRSCLLPIDSNIRSTCLAIGAPCQPPSAPTRTHPLRSCRTVPHCPLMHCALILTALSSSLRSHPHCALILAALSSSLRSHPRCALILTALSSSLRYH